MVLTFNFNVIMLELYFCFLALITTLVLLYGLSNNNHTFGANHYSFTFDGQFMIKINAKLMLLFHLTAANIICFIFLFQFGVIFGGAQKNIGTAGVTVVIIREDLLGSPMTICPSVFDFTYIHKLNSIHNTPATFS